MQLWQLVGNRWTRRRKCWPWDCVTLSVRFSIRCQSLDLFPEALSITLLAWRHQWEDFIPVYKFQSTEKCWLHDRVRDKLRYLCSNYHVQGVIVILALTLLTPYFYYIPRATLSSVIICAVIFMVEINILQPIWKCSSEY